MGPRFLVRSAGLEMHPIDTADRTRHLKDEGGIGLCNITKCCTEVCPEHIKITDNAIIPLKERVADKYYDPIQMVWRKLRGDRATRRVADPAGTRPARRRRSRSERVRQRSDALAGPARRGEGRCAAARHPDRRRGARQPRARRRPEPSSSTPRARTRATREHRPTPRSRTILGVQTNNVAEYTGVVRALDLARELGAREVALLLDSKLIVEQLAGRWRVKDAKLIPLWEAARSTLRSFDRWSAVHVPRAQNSAADALANEAIDRAQAGGPASVVRRPGT